MYLKKLNKILKEDFKDDNYQISNVHLKEYEGLKQIDITVAKFDLKEKNSSNNTTSWTFDISLNQKNTVLISGNNKSSKETASNFKKQLQSVEEKLAEALIKHPNIRLRLLFKKNI